MRDLLGKTMTEGKSLRALAPEIQKLLDSHGGDVKLYGQTRTGKTAYQDLVLRTATQTSFAGGRYSAMFGTEREKLAPYVQFHCIHDDRTRPAHRALDGRVFRKDDPAARHYFPPLGFNCRCYLSDLDATDFDDGGYQVTRGWQVPTIETPDGGVVGRPEGSWDVDRVESTRSRALGEVGSGATHAGPLPGDDPPIAARSIQEALEELALMKTRERGYLFRPDGSPLIALEGDAKEVSFGVVPPVERFGLDAAHNHLRGESFSLGDVKYAIENGVPRMYAVTPGRKIYILEPPTGGWGSTPEARAFQSNHFRDAWNEARAAWQARTGKVFEDTVEGFEEVLLEVLKETALHFRVEMMG